MTPIFAWVLIGVVITIIGIIMMSIAIKIIWRLKPNEKPSPKVEDLVVCGFVLILVGIILSFIFGLLAIGGV